MNQAAPPDSRIRAAVRKLVVDTFGSKPRHIRQETAGLSNFVYSVEHAAGEFIVRVNPDPEKLAGFLKSQWVTARAARAGVPVPEILQVGGVPLPHMILRKSLGQPGTASPDRLRLLHQLGRYAALLNSIPTLGFGASFNWAGDGVPSRPAWHDFLHTELKLDGRLDTLRVRRMLPDNRLRKIRSILEGACGRGRRPALNHGDLRLKNVIVDDKGEISTILDWEDCISSLAPEWELSLALHDLTIDEKQVFVRGYGLRPKDFTAIAPVIKALNIINYVAEVERLARDKNRAELESCRMRLSGSLDLYCI